MAHFTIKHLRYFVALAHHRHFGRAADDCAISQPALSVQVKELEDLLGAPLVERGGRQLHLTAFGEVLAARAQEILTAVDDLATLGSTFRGGGTGRMRIGVIPTVAPYFLPSVFRTLADHYPGLELHPREALTRKLVEAVLQGQIDTAIVALPIAEPALTEHVLFREEFVLVRPQADAGKPAPSVSALREMRLLLLEEGHCFRNQALSYCKMASVPARDLVEGSSLSTLVQLVGSGIGVTLIPEMAVAIETRSAPVAVVRMAKPGANRTIGMVWRKTNPMAALFVGIAKVLSRDASHSDSV